MSWSGYPQVDLNREGYPSLQPPREVLPPRPVLRCIMLAGPIGVPRGVAGHRRQREQVQQWARVGWQTELNFVRGNDERL
jgi:hypothetical protein